MNAQTKAKFRQIWNEKINNLKIGDVLLYQNGMYSTLYVLTNFTNTTASFNVHYLLDDGSKVIDSYRTTLPKTWLYTLWNHSFMILQSENLEEAVWLNLFY